LQSKGINDLPIPKIEGLTAPVGLLPNPTSKIVINKLLLLPLAMKHQQI
jgi:hypothetical protein